MVAIPDPQGGPPPEQHITIIHPPPVVYGGVELLLQRLMHTSHLLFRCAQCQGSPHFIQMAEQANEANKQIAWALFRYRHNPYEKSPEEGEVS